MNMANRCKNTITIIGLEEAPETFVKELSRVMLRVDLDEMDPNRWGEDPSIDGKHWYASLVDEYRQEGAYAARYGILYPRKPYERLGVSAPRFYLETKWGPPLDKLVAASKTFPELMFHLDWWILQDGPAGEFVIKNGRILEQIERRGSWYLFDWPILYPTISLLPAHLPYSLAQRGALRVEDAVDIVRELRRILEEGRFTGSPCQAYRDQEKLKQTRQALDGLLEQMQEAAKQLTFEGVFISDPPAWKIFMEGTKKEQEIVQEEVQENLARDAEEHQK
jgi:hypothetical protein